MARKALRILELRAENVKRLRAVHIKPDGSLIVVGGKNAAGKSSVLDSIAYAMGGSRLICDRPLRQGEESGGVFVDLGDLRVRRGFREDGASTLVVEARDGARYPSPQKMLDELVGKLSFDPLAFSRMDAHEQLDTLKDLMGVDVAQLEEDARDIYNERTHANREVKRLEGVVASAPDHGELPEEEVSVAEIASELERAGVLVRDYEGAKAHKIVCENALERDRVQIDRIAEETQELTDRVAGLIERRRIIEESIPAVEQQIATAEQEIAEKHGALLDTVEIRTRMRDAEEMNVKIRANATHAERREELQRAQDKAKGLTHRLGALNDERERVIVAAMQDFPVEGVGFDARNVLLNGLPFDQASSAEQLRVSVAMGIAANPTVRVLLIRDGSLLDAENLKMIAKMAQDADAQVWLERVEEDEATSVVIEDGTVRGQEEATDVPK